MSGKRPGDNVGPAGAAKRAKTAMTTEQMQALINSTKASVEKRAQQLGIQPGTSTPPVAASGFKMPAPISQGTAPTAQNGFVAPLPHGSAARQTQFAAPLPRANASPQMNAAQISARAMAEQLKARMSNIASLGPNFGNKYAPAAQASAQQFEKDVAPKSLRFDEQGRFVDADGNVIEVNRRTNHLQANMRARREQEEKERERRAGGVYVHKEKAEVVPEVLPYMDPRITMKDSGRKRRAMVLVEPGKYERVAENIRTKHMVAQLEKEIGEAAEKTGISASTKLALLTPKDTLGINVPVTEWWDAAVLVTGLYPDEGVDVKAVTQPTTEGEDAKKGVHGIFRGVTNLVEHPVPHEPPAESDQNVAIPLYLTKKERVKIRRQRRREAWQEEQEKIRLGLVVPKNKLKLSNFMQALKDDAVADPTKLEKEVRKQMAERQAKHENANAERQLTNEQRREKKDRKLTEDVSKQVQVMVFRLKHLKDYQKKFKVDLNATQLHLTGGVIATPEITLIIAEGGPKNMKKYKRLLLNRIKWEEKSKPRAGQKKRPFGEDDMLSESDDDDVDEPNSCTLVWEGIQQQPAFTEWLFKRVTSTPAAREYLEEHSMANLFDLALTETIVKPDQDSAL